MANAQERDIYFIDLLGEHTKCEWTAVDITLFTVKTIIRMPVFTNVLWMLGNHWKVMSGQSKAGEVDAEWILVTEADCDLLSLPVTSQQQNH